MDQIRLVLAEQPDLSAYGFAYGGAVNSGLEFEENRARMLTDDFSEQVANATRYIALKGIPRRVGSYGLKHLVENWVYTKTGKRPYVSNGAAIVAASNAGYELVRETGSPNCTFKKR